LSDIGLTALDRLARDGLRVRRDGPKGWHWISAESFDPAVHELFDQPKEAKPAPKKRGRKPKTLTENPDDGNR
jgi:hypothetical protein